MANKAKLNRIRELVASMSVSEKLSLLAGKDAWVTCALPRLGVEAVRMADGTSGLRREAAGAALSAQPVSEPATAFPTESALACSFDTELAEDVAEAMGEQARAAGVNLLLAPAVNLKRGPLGGRNFEYYSEDPLLSGALGAACIRGLRRKGVGACLKHFCCNNEETDRFRSDSRIDPRTLHDLYLEPFRIAVEQGQPAAVMASYNKVNGRYVSEDASLLGDTLRGEFGFEGAVMSDWGGIDDRVAALAAGTDLQMPGPAAADRERLREALSAGELTEQQLDEAAVRLLAMAEDCTMGGPVVLGSDYARHHALARRAARECMVLLKNENGLLPFEGAQPVALIGAFAETPRTGGRGSSLVAPIETPPMRAAFAEAGVLCLPAAGYNADGSTNSALITEAKRALTEAGRGVLVLGLPEGAESEGFDRDDMKLPDGMLKLADALLSTGVPLACVLMVGSPVELPFEPRTPAILLAGLCGEATGEAAADILLGRANPSGRLAESWPRRYEDTPAARFFAKGGKKAEYRETRYVGYRYYDCCDVKPLYPFGWGLSYSAMQFLGAACDKRQLQGERQKLTVTVRVKNMGERPAAVPLQLYAGLRQDKLRGLVAFAKLRIMPGETKTERIEVPAEVFMRYDPGTGRRRLAAGDYQLTVSYMSGSAGELAGFEVNVAPRDGYCASPWPAADKLLTDEEFASLAGEPAEEPADRYFDRNSTPNDLAGTLPGRTLIETMRSRVVGDGKYDRINFERALCETPLRAVAAMSGGALSDRKAKGLIELANNQLIRGMIDVLAK